MRLPLESRDAWRLAERLNPIRLEWGFAWLVSLAGSCFACVVSGSSYRVSFAYGNVRDALSGLTLRLPEPRGLVDGRPVWKARWRRGLLRVDSIECDALVAPDGSVRCLRTGATCDGERCLLECLAPTRGP